ncbi:MAG: hypothetical protein R3C52_04640 [Hyphomonadaceae bacterium]
MAIRVLGGVAALALFGHAAALAETPQQGPVLPRPTISLELVDAPRSPSLRADLMRDLVPSNITLDFKPAALSGPATAARFERLDLSTPEPLRGLRNPGVSATMSLSAPAHTIPLGLDLEVAPRARFEASREGLNLTRLGAEIRLGQGLSDRDLRNSNSPAPAWYFYVGADNQAVVLNVADRQSLSGVVLRDQVTVGDVQAGLAWRAGYGGQWSVGLIERKTRFNADLRRDRDVSRRERFVAFSFTLKR